MRQAARDEFPSSSRCHPFRRAFLGRQNRWHSRRLWQAQPLAGRWMQYRRDIHLLSTTQPWTRTSRLHRRRQELANFSSYSSILRRKTFGYLQATTRAILFRFGIHHPYVRRETHRAFLLRAVDEAEGMPHLMQHFFRKPLAQHIIPRWKPVKFLLQATERDDRHGAVELRLSEKKAQHGNREVNIGDAEYP